MHDQMPMTTPKGAIAALPKGAMAALALPDALYGAEAAPWWLTASWLTFFLIAFSLLLANLLQLG